MRAGMVERHDFGEQWLPLCGRAPVWVVLLGLDPAGFTQTEQIVDASAYGERALTAPYRTADLVGLYIAKPFLKRDNSGVWRVRHGRYQGGGHVSRGERRIPVLTFLLRSPVTCGCIRG